MSKRNESQNDAQTLAALRQFKERLESSADFHVPTHLEPGNMGYGIHDDATLLRFLTARKLSIDDAVAHYEKASRFRTANRLGELYDGMSTEAFEETRNLYPHWCGRVCHEGKPIYVFDASVLNSLNMAAFRKSSARLNITTAAVGTETKPTIEMIRAVLCFDHLTRFVLPLCSGLIGESEDARSVSKIVLLVDLSGMTIGQFWSLKGYLQNFIQLLSTSFPEILDKVFVTNAPSSFQWIWNLIKGWADPITVSKFTFLASNEVDTTLKERIDVRDIPQKYGGALPHEHGMPPMLDERLRKLLDWSENFGENLPKGPLKWVRAADGRINAVATGNVNGQAQEICFAMLHRNRDLAEEAAILP